MGIIRDSFVVFKDWAESIEALPEEYQLEGYKALAYYGLHGEPPTDTSPVITSLMISFRTVMKDNIARYNASVENGKKGGRPKKELTQKIENLEEPNQNLEKPRETQENLEEPNPNLNVNDNVNVNSKLINNIYNNLNACTGARVRERKDFERQPIIDYFSSFFGLYRGKYYDAGLEIVDCILEALDVAHYSSNGLVFKGKRYNSEEFVSIIAKITNEEFGRIVNQLVFNGVIESRHWYILGCLIKACNTPSEREDYEQEQFVNDMINLNESEV